MKLFFASLLVAISSVSFAATPQGAAPQESRKPAPAAELNAAQKLAEAILAAVKANNERLEGVELTLTRDFQDKSVKEVTKVREPLPNGGAIVTTRVPASQRHERAVVLEDRVRFETGGEGQYPRVTYWFDGIRWTRANENGGRITKMRTDQLGGRMYDPREVVGVDPRTSLANMLAPSALEDATVQTQGTVSTIDAKAPGGGRLKMSFDSAFGLLPTKSAWFHAEGGLIREAVTTYDRLAERGAWVVREMVEHYFDLAANPAETPADWKQEMRTAVACRPLDRAAAEKELVAAIPAGNAAYDFTDGAAGLRKPDPPATRVVSRTESSMMWFLGAHVVLFAAAAAVYLWRRTAVARA